MYNLVAFHDTVGDRRHRRTLHATGSPGTTYDSESWCHHTVLSHCTAAVWIWFSTSHHWQSANKTQSPHQMEQRQRRNPRSTLTHQKADKQNASCMFLINTRTETENSSFPATPTASSNRERKASKMQIIAQSTYPGLSAKRFFKS